MSATRILVVLVLLLGGPARASDASGLSGYAVSAVEGLPDAYGETGIRARQRLRGEAEVADDWEIEADGAFRAEAFSDETGELDLYRLVVMGEGGPGRLSIGRTARLDPRGFQHLDGIAAETHPDGVLGGSLWAGRLWHPEIGLPLGDAPEEWHPTWVGGGALQLRPQAGQLSRGIALSAGWEGRLVESDFGQSIFGGLALRGAKGASGTFDVETRPELLGEGTGSGLRAGTRAFLPLGRRFMVGPELRWEGLPPSTLPATTRSPIEWLGAHGYGVAALALRWGQGDWSAWASGGPVLRPEAPDYGKLGGLGRGGIGWAATPGLGLGLFGLSAATGGSWVSGGGLEARLGKDETLARLESGVYRFQGIDGFAGTVTETRLSGQRALVHGDAGALALMAEVAAGADRLLEPYLRGGLALHGRLGGREH